MDNFPLSQETDHIIHVRVVRQTENIVVGEAGLLFWCDLVKTTFSTFSGIQAVCNGVDPVLQTLQDFLEALSVHVTNVIKLEA